MRRFPLGRSQTAPPLAPVAPAAAAVVVPGLHDQDWTGPLLQDQDCGPALTAGPRCRSPQAYDTSTGQGGGSGGEEEERRRIKKSGEQR